MGIRTHPAIVCGHMILKKILPAGLLLAALLLPVAGCSAEKPPAPPRCTVMAFNVENLFDLDPVSLYEDFAVTGDGPDRWTPEKLAGKLARIAAVVKTAGGGRGPDVLILNELEADHTPDSAVAPEAFVAAHRGRDYRDLLRGELVPALAGAPVEAWLLKALEDEGLSGYKIILGEVRDLSKEAIRCAILTRLPIRSSRQHRTEAARTIVEAEVEFGGESLFVFANHWKSGAGNAQTELTRIQNAGVARARLDEILKADPKANIVFGGDLNSHYNHRQRYPFMPKTGIQDVLGSQGDAAKLASGAADLYNLWFDVEPAARKSDDYQGEWGTLMHIVISRGLADGKGVDYVGGSFGPSIITGLNAHAYPVVPWRLTNYGPGAGVSDHFPIKAEFALRTEAGEPPLTRPEFAPAAGLPAFPAELDRSKLRAAASLPSMNPEQVSQAIGELFVLEGTFNGGAKPSITVAGVRYPVYVPEPRLFGAVKATKKDSRIDWVGQLNFYKGHLEFSIESADWIKAR